MISRSRCRWSRPNFRTSCSSFATKPSHEADSEAALKEIEGDADEYRGIAERRVRLGLLLSEIGQANGIEVTQAEMNRLIGQAASQYQPKDRERFIQYIQQEPMAAAQLRAPLYEDKVVDFLFSKAEITERAVSRAEIEADLESEEGHVHGPGCGHDHSRGQAGEGEESRGQAGQGSGQGRAKPSEPAKGSVKPAAKAGQAQACRAGEEGGRPRRLRPRPLRPRPRQSCAGQGRFDQDRQTCASPRRAKPAAKAIRRPT